MITTLSRRKALLKSLATTSILVTAFHAESTLALVDVYTGTETTSILSNSAHWDKVAVPGAVEVDSLKLGAADQNFTIDLRHQLAGVDLDGLDAVGKILIKASAGSVDTGNNLDSGGSLGSIGNKGATGMELELEAATADVDSNIATYTYTLTGKATVDAGPAVGANDYSGLKSVKLGENTTLAISMASYDPPVANAGQAPVVFNNTFDGDANGHGALYVNSPTQFKKNIGSAHELEKITVNSTTTIGGAGSVITEVHAANTILNAVNTDGMASDYNADRTLIIDATANDIEYFGAIDGAADGVGELFIEDSANKTTFHDAVGSEHALSRIGARSGAVEFEDDVNAETISLGSGEAIFGEKVKGDIELDHDSKVNIKGDLDGTIATYSNGLNPTTNEVHFANVAGTTATVTGKVGGDAPANAIKILTTDDGDVHFNETVNANDIATGSGEVTFDKTVTGNVKLYDDNSVVNFAGNVDGAIDNKTMSVNNTEVHFTNAVNSVNVSGKVGETDALKVLTTAAGEVHFGDEVKAETITTGGRAFFNGVTGTTLNVGNGGAEFAGETESNIHIVGTDPGINLGDKLTGNITTATANKGVLNVVSDTIILGNVGDVNKAVNSITFQGDHTATIGDGTGPREISANIINGGAADGEGTLEFLDVTTLRGNIGSSDVTANNVTTNGKALGSMTLADGKKLELWGSIHGSETTGVKTVVSLGNGSILDFAQEGATINAVIQGAAQGKGKVSVAANNIKLYNVGPNAGHAIDELYIEDGVNAKLDGPMQSHFHGTGIVLGDGASLEVDQLLDFAGGATIEGADDSQGTLKILGGNIIATLPEIGGTHELKAVSVGKSDSTVALGSVAAPLTFANDISANELILVTSANHPLNLALTNKINVDKITGAGSLIVPDDATTEADIGAAGTSIDIIFNHATLDKTLTFDKGGAGDAQKLYVNIKSNSGHGFVDIDNPVELYGNIGGDAGNNLNAITFNADSSFGGTMLAPVIIGDGIDLEINVNNTILNKINAAVGADNTSVTVKATGVQFNDEVGGGVPIHILSIENGGSATINKDMTFDAEADSGIVFDGVDSTLTVAKNVVLTFGTDHSIDAVNDGDGKLILNDGVVINKIIGFGEGNRIGEIEVIDNPIIAAGVLVDEISFKTSDSSLTLTDAFDINTITVQNGVQNTALIIAENGIINGNVGALSEIVFDADKTLTSKGSLSAARVTATTQDEGTLNIVAAANVTITPEIYGIKQVNLTNTSGAAINFTLSNSIQAADGINFLAGEADDKLIIGSNDKYKPQGIAGNVTSSVAGNGILSIQGYGAVYGDIIDLQKISLDAANSILYLGNAAGATIDLDTPIAFNDATSSILIFANDTNITKAITIPTGKSYGSINTTGLDANYARTANEAGNEFTWKDKAYTGTITITADVGSATSSLKLIDAGKGNVVLGGTATDISIAELNAKTLTLNSNATTYNIPTLAIEELVLADDISIKAGLLGTKSKPLKAKLTFDDGAKRTLTVVSGDINLDKNIAEGTSGGHHHDIVFSDDTNVYSQLGSDTSRFGTFTVTTADKRVNFHKDIYLDDAGSVTVGTDATVGVYGKVDGKILPDADGAGTVVADGSAIINLKQVGDIAGNLHVGTFNMSASKVRVTGDFAVKDIEFTKSGELLITANDIAGSITQKIGDSVGTIIFEGGDPSLVANIGTAKNRIKHLQLKSASSKMTLDKGVFYTTVTGSSRGMGNVEVKDTISPGLDLGAKDLSINTVAFTGTNAEVRNIFANRIDYGTGATKVSNVIGVGKLGENSKLTVIDKGSLENVFGHGTVEFEGSGSLKLVGTQASPLAALDLINKGIITMDTDNIYADKVTQTNSEIQVKNGLKINGDYIANNATLTMVGGTFTSLKNNTFTGTYTVTATPTPGTTILNFGSSNMDIGSLESVKLHFPVGDTLPANGKTVALIIIKDEEVRKKFLELATGDSGNHFIRDTITQSGDAVSDTQNQNFALVENATTLPPAAKEAFMQFVDAPGFAADLGNIKDPVQAELAIKKATAVPETTGSAVGGAATSAVASVVNTRMAAAPAPVSVAAPAAPAASAGGGGGSAGSSGAAGGSSGGASGGSASSDSSGGGGGSSKAAGAKSGGGGGAAAGGTSGGGGETSGGSAASSDTEDADATAAPEADLYGGYGVAAGDVIEDVAEKFGIWAQAVGGISNQDPRKGNSAFKSSTIGGIVGIDTLVNDDVSLGFAVGNVASSTKFKGGKEGDKTTSSSWMFVAYGNYNINSNWFVRGSLVAGANAINSKEKRIGAKGDMVAQSKYSLESYSAEANVGYNFPVGEGSTITPSVGIRTTYSSDVSYAETGAGVQNKQINQKSAITNTGLVGVGFSTSTYFEDVKIAPEAHVNLQHGLGVKSPQGRFRPVAGTKVVNFVGTKPCAFSTTLGGSVTATSDNVEYSVGYDVSISDKFIGQQGSVKVKLKF